MSYFKCKCGCELFFQSIPELFGDRDVRVIGTNKPIPPEHKSIALLTCIECGRITIPSTSLVGKNALDLDVQVYRKLIDFVTNHNKAISVGDNNLDVMQNTINRTFELTDRIKTLEYEVTQLKSNLDALRDMCADIDPNVINPRLDGLVGEASVKAGKRSKKSS